MEERDSGAARVVLWASAMSVVPTRAMIRLPVDCQHEGHRAVAALYEGSGLCFPLIRAVIDGLQRGAVWVDDPVSPASAFVVTGFGFSCFLGAADNDAFNRALRDHLLCDTGQPPGYLLWYTPPPQWRPWLDKRVGGTVRRRERARLALSGAQPSSHGDQDTYPDGLRLSPLDASLIPEADRMGLNLSTRFWSSAADFLQHGFGSCLVGPDGALASLCYSSCVAGNLAEVDIATREERRGQGCAGVVARAFIRQCAQRRIAPTWDCFIANDASLRLATSLGFVETLRYPLYSFQTPLPSRPPFDSGPNQ